MHPPWLRRAPTAWRAVASCLTDERRRVLCERDGPVTSARVRPRWVAPGAEFDCNARVWQYSLARDSTLLAVKP